MFKFLHNQNLLPTLLNPSLPGSGLFWCRRLLILDSTCKFKLFEGLPLQSTCEAPGIFLLRSDGGHGGHMGTELRMATEYPKRVPILLYKLHTKPKRRHLSTRQA